MSVFPRFQCTIGKVSGTPVKLLCHLAGLAIVHCKQNHNEKDFFRQQAHGQTSLIGEQHDIVTHFLL